jgi:hypothetical protein
MEKAGRAVAVLSPGKNVTPTGLPGKKQTLVGAIAPAMGGAYLSADEIANYAARR